MKKFIWPIIIFLGLLFITCVFLFSTAEYDSAPSPEKIQSRVFKTELPANATEEEIARILIQRMMNKHSIGTLGWVEWIWTYEIKKINLTNGYDQVEIHVKPLFPQFSWRNYWESDINWVGNGWVEVDYLMVIEDKGDYYELRGPFTGG
jgi:hypothetical protein